MNLPLPSPDALAASLALQRKIADEIAASGGWMPFARYMEMALYEPGLGYYQRAVSLGKDGDFVTAPEISSLFGQTLAQAVLPFLEQSAFCLLELGAGSGKLAYDMLSEWARLGVVPEDYAILEVSPAMRMRQQERLAVFPQVRWLDALPKAFTGVVVANEVLDALPVHRVVKRGGLWQELGVGISAGGLVFREKPASAAVREAAARQIPDAEALPEGYVTEVHVYACALVRSLAAMQLAGRGSAAVLVDYGYPAREYYLPKRRDGTLLSCYRHRTHPDTLWQAGLQDITAHVDFTAIAGAAMEGGLDLLCYASQADFLLAGGITERLAQLSPPGTARYLAGANEANRLLSPAEMGELFKVMVIGNLDLPPRLVVADRSERL
ncbi:MAG: SAM-dependent methyltransferase [Oxalobacter formigenes]|nr:SAM-dependent methyltransferase [Oxalobacter formigenes]